MDAFLTVYALAPRTLPPLARSARLRPAVSAAVAALAVDEEQVYLSDAALGETVILRRGDLQVAQTLPVALQKEAEARYSAAMLAVDPGRHLFLVSVERNGDVDIYWLSEQEAVPLITGPGFDGHPAGTSVWWEPTFAGW